MAGQRFLNRDFLILVCIGFFTVGADLLILITAASYSDDRFGTSSSASALASCAFVIGAIISRMLLGPRIDALGRRRCLIIAGLFGGLACFVNIYCADLLQFCIVRAVHGFFYGISLLCANSMVASVVPLERRAEGIGLFTLSYTIASAIGPYAGMILAYDGNYETIFNAAGVCCIATMMLALLLKSGGPVEVESSPVKGFRSLVEPSALRICLVVFVFGLSYSSLLTFSTVYGKAIHLEYAMVNFYLVEAFATFLSRSVLAKVPDRYGDNIALIPCFILYTAAVFVFAYADSSLSIYFCGAAMGFMIAFITSVGESISIRRVGMERYSLCLSMFQNFYDVSLAVGPIMLGLVADGYGYSAMYVVAGFIALASFIMYIFLHGITKNRLEYKQLRH